MHEKPADLSTLSVFFLSQLMFELWINQNQLLFACNIRVGNPLTCMLVSNDCRVMESRTKESTILDHWCPREETWMTCSKSTRGISKRQWEKHVLTRTGLTRTSESYHILGKYFLVCSSRCTIKSADLNMKRAVEPRICIHRSELCSCSFENLRLLGHS